MSITKKTYPQGNTELLSMFKSKTFDKDAALRCMQSIMDINQPILDLDGYSSTYLYEAESNNNVEAVRFLLKNGADPNANHDSLTLWDLQYAADDPAQNSSRYEIAKLFFEHGADPDIECEDGETLFDYVFYKVFNDAHDSEWNYLCQFFMLLIAYGGGGGTSHYPKPQLTEPIAKTRINEYELKLFLCEDGYHLEGHIFNPDGIDIGCL